VIFVGLAKASFLHVFSLGQHCTSTIAMLVGAEQQAIVLSQLEALYCPYKPIDLPRSGDGIDRDDGGG
jgi:hypothetical protein